MRNMCSELRSKWNSIPPAFRGNDYTVDSIYYLRAVGDVKSRFIQNG